jgi:hypothetical protein
MPLVPSVKLIGAAAAILMLGTAVASASEATLVADRAGFLIGHGHRCGVAEGSLQRSQQVIAEVIAAFAVDEVDRQDAEDRLTLRVLASALARHLDDPLPSCTAIRSQLTRLQQHRPPPLARSHSKGDGRMVRNDRAPPEAAPPPTQSDLAAGAGAGRATARKPATTRREELSPERRAALELKRTAQRMRGRPPSI